MPTSKELREKRAPLAKDIRRIADAAAEHKNEDGTVGRTLSADEQGRWDKVNSDYNALTRQIEQVERAEAVEAEQRTVAGDPRVGRPNFDGRTADAERVRALALAGWLAVPTHEGATAEQAEAMAACGLNPHAKSLRLSLSDTHDYRRMQGEFRNGARSRAVDRALGFRATMTEGTGATGGFLLAPEALRASLEVNMLAFGGVRQVAETIRTATGEPITWPTADDTSNTGEQIGETTDVSNSGAGGPDVSIGLQSWYSYDYHSKMVLVPKNLLRDSVFDLPSLLGGMLGERLGRITNTRQTTGSGANTMTGIVTGAAAFSAASATAIAYDDVIKLEHAIDPAYRNLPGCGYMLHDAILLALRLLKDGAGQYLWKSNEPAGMADTLNNRPMTINQDMDSTISSGKKTLLFGHMPSYKIRTVGSIEVIRLDERYAEYRRVAFDAFTSEDAKLLSTTTARMKALTH